MTSIKQTGISRSKKDLLDDKQNMHNTKVVHFHHTATLGQTQINTQALSVSIAGFNQASATDLASIYEYRANLRLWSSLRGDLAHAKDYNVVGSNIMFAGDLLAEGALVNELFFGELWIPLNNFSVETTSTGSGSGEVNFLSSKVFSDFGLFNDGVVTKPVNGLGTGSTTGISLLELSGAARLDTTDGILNLSFQKTAVNKQGCGFKVDFATRGEIDKYQWIDLVINHKDSTNLLDDMLNFYLYDVDNSKLMEPVDPTLYATSLSRGDTFKFFVSGGTNYRLIGFVKTTSALAFDTTLILKVAPQMGKVQGAFDTDWENFPSVAAGVMITSTGTSPTYGTVANNKARYKRRSSDFEIEWDFAQSGAGTAGTGQYLFNLPNGLEFDDTFYDFNTNVTQGSTTLMMQSGVGTAHFNFEQGTSKSHGVGVIIPYSKNQVKVYLQYATELGSGSGDSGYFGEMYPFILAPMSISFRMKAKCKGWMANTDISTSYSNREISFCANLSMMVSVNTILTFGISAVSVDTLNSRYLNGYRILESGDYEVDLTRSSPPTSAASNCYCEVLYGSVYEVGTLQILDTNSITSNATWVSVASGRKIVYLEKGTYVWARIQTNSWSATYPFTGVLTITKASSSSQTRAANNPEGFDSFNLSGQSIPNVTETVITRWTKQNDYLETFNQTTGVAELKSSGQFLLSASVHPVIDFGTGYANFKIEDPIFGTYYKNMPVIKNSSNLVISASASLPITASKGAKISVTVYQNSGSARLLVSSSNNINFFHIAKVGL